MKKSTLMSTLAAMTMVGTASAADVVLYYSPSCPHCHRRCSVLFPVVPALPPRPRIHQPAIGL